MEGQPDPIGKWFYARLFLCQGHSDLIMSIHDQIRLDHAKLKVSSLASITTRAREMIGLKIPGHDRKEGPLPVWSAVRLICMMHELGDSVRLKCEVVQYLSRLLITTIRVINEHPISQVSNLNRVSPSFIVCILKRDVYNYLACIPLDMRTVIQYKSIFRTIRRNPPLSPRNNRKRKCEFTERYSQ